MTIESSSADQELSSGQDEDPYDAHLARTFVPLSNNRLTEEETIRQSVQDRQCDQPHVVPPIVMWPPTSGTSTELYQSE